MKIFSVRPIINFKSDNVIAYDDSVSQERRKFIREHYEYETMPYQSIYEKEPRLDEYQLKNMMDFFAKKPKKIDGDKLSELPLYNVHNISTSMRYHPQIYRGSTLYDAPESVLNQIKDIGVQTVINVGTYGKSYKEKIEKAGLRYFDFDIEDKILDDRWSGKIEPEEKKENLIDFIKEMQKEYIYMGCECGTYKTDMAVFLNTLFNPKVKGYCKIYSPEKVSAIPDIAREIYEVMTPEDKESLGWTPEFESRFREKVGIFKRY